jgi:predicted alpha/beta hydrolase family esterase
MANANASSGPQGAALLIVPGLENSGPDHWQTHWERELPEATRVDLGNWEKPHRNTWVNKLNLAIHRAGRPVILVAHSLGCLAVAWWARYEQPEPTGPVLGALLVAPPEVDFFPRDERLTPFAPIPLDPLPFASTLVASRNDPWISLPTAEWMAHKWGSEFVDVGEAGHINAETDLGSWLQGRELLARLQERTGLFDSGLGQQNLGAGIEGGAPGDNGLGDFLAKFDAELVERVYLQEHPV